MRQVNNYERILPSQQLHLQIQLSRFEILYHKKYKLVYHSYVRAPLRRVRQFLLLPLLPSKVYLSASQGREGAAGGFRKCRE